MSPATQQLVVYFPFDEIEGTSILDASGNGNNGTVQGSPRILPDDTFGSCIDLDQQTTWATLPPQSVPAGNAITVSFWAKGGPALPTNTSILCATNAQGLRSLNIHLPWVDGTIYFDCGNDGTNVDRIQQAAQSTDYRGAWSHWAFTKDATAGTMQIFLNGVLWQSATGKTMPIPAATQVTFGAYAPGSSLYQGQIANLRIYSRALSVEEIAQDLADDRTALTTFRSSNPLDFYLRDENDQDVLYIDDDPQNDNLRLGITNTARQVIELAASRNPGAASANNHHFELKFRPGALSAATLVQLALEEAGWKLATARQIDGGVSIYLLCTDPQTIAPSATIELHLRHISADPGGGTRGTRVELAYQQMQYQGETIPLGGGRIKQLEIVNQRGKKTIPLNVGFIGSGAILNDGQTPNTLTLRLTNVSPTDTIALNPASSPTPSKFIISFDVQGDWALGTPAQVGAITITASDWGSTHPTESDWSIQKITTGASPRWEVTHLNATEPGMAPGHVLQLTISNIISSLPSGQTNLYVSYEHIPGYWEGQFFRTIEKGPLLVAGQNVGIGVANPVAPLHVRGEARVEGRLAVDAQFSILTDHPWSDHNRTLLELKPNYQNDANRTQVFLYAPNAYYTNEPAITLAGNYGAGAQVGIGTKDPVAPLHVKGEARVEGLLRVVGTGLIGDGNNYANGAGNMAAGSLTIGSITANYGGGTNWNANVAGLLLETAANTEIAVHDANTRLASLLYYEGDTANRITIGRDMAWGAIGTLVLNGNVGIGTSSPGAKLDVSQGAGLVIRTEPAPASSVYIGRSNQNSLQFDYAWGTALNSTASISLNIDSNKDDTDRYIDFSTGGAGFAGGSSLLRVQQNGNVGVGTPTPTARLHVIGAGLIGEGHNVANADGHMAAGSLTLGSITMSYGGGTSWNTNVAGLLFETAANTEIAVHDSGTRLASLLYYEGDAANRITIGRDMGWGAISTLMLNGNVGIGFAPTTNMKLQVAGDMYAMGRVYCLNGINVWFNGVWRTHNGMGWQETTGPFYGQMVPRSDMRLKQDVQTLPQALEQVLGLRGVSFKWNELGLEQLTQFVESYNAGPGASEEATRQIQAVKRAEAYERLARPEIGLIAQEVRRVAPELVSEDADGYLGVAYERVVALLIEAIKEQQAMIDELAGSVVGMQQSRS